MFPRLQQNSEILQLNMLIYTGRTRQYDSWVVLFCYTIFTGTLLRFKSTNNLYICYCVDGLGSPVFFTNSRFFFFGYRQVIRSDTTTTLFLLSILHTSSSQLAVRIFAYAFANDTRNLLDIWLANVASP